MKPTRRQRELDAKYWRWLHAPLLDEGFDDEALEPVTALDRRAVQIWLMRQGRQQVL